VLLVDEAVADPAQDSPPLGEAERGPARLGFARARDGRGHRLAVRDRVLGQAGAGGGAPHLDRPADGDFADGCALGHGGASWPERRGLEYVLLEQAPAIDTVGAGLLLSPNATRLLRKLDLLDRILPLGRATTRWRILDDGGRVLREIRLPETDEPGISIHRADL